MRPFRAIIVSVLILAPSLSFPQEAKKVDESIDLNFGFSAAKSALGFSYNHGRNQFTLGFHGLAYSTRDGYFFQPGVAYNRYFTKNGFFGSVGLVTTYHNRDIWQVDFSDTINPGRHVVTDEKGWETGIIFTGLGKSWQFHHWGLHVDAGLATTADEDFAREWGYYLGGAVSYRFHLN
jgi:hypothetical protein